jgi:hypothetical protein
MSAVQVLLLAPYKDHQRNEIIDVSEPEAARLVQERVAAYYGRPSPKFLRRAPQDKMQRGSYVKG